MVKKKSYLQLKIKSSLMVRFARTSETKSEHILKNKYRNMTKMSSKCCTFILVVIFVLFYFFHSFLYECIFFLYIYVKNIYIFTAIIGRLGLVSGKSARVFIFFCSTCKFSNLFVIIYGSYLWLLKLNQR